MQTTTVKHILDHYEAILIDAYGVLVDSSGALPGAAAFVEALAQRQANYYILTNDASRLPENIARRFAGLGLPIDADRIITSGGLLTAYFAANNLTGKRCIVLGNADAVAYAEQAGAKVVPAAADSDAEVLVLADASGFAFLPAVEAVLTLVMRRWDAGRPMRLLLCNPDILYPAGDDAYGLTSGAIATVLEAAWATRHRGADGPRFVGLGKPFAPIFEAAVARSGTGHMVLIGDQLGTDVLGARNFGIDSVLVGSGLTRVGPGVTLDPEPTYYLPAVGPA